jgi:A/G-specific adenine glycosylase
VIRWQRSHGRSGLPWQRTRDPYRVWLSEIMLQQTQVTTVLATTRASSSASRRRRAGRRASGDVLALWSGLGYYARARNLHRCAQVVREHRRPVSADAAALAELPGIGRSTAAAIAAFCFGERARDPRRQRQARADARLAYEGDLSSAASKRELWAIAPQPVARRRARPALDAAMAATRRA